MNFLILNCLFSFCKANYCAVLRYAVLQNIHCSFNFHYNCTKLFITFSFPKCHFIAHSWSEWNNVWHFSNDAISHSYRTLDCIAIYSHSLFLSLPVSLSADELPLHVPTGLHCRLRHVAYLSHYSHSCVHSLQVRAALSALDTHRQKAMKRKNNWDVHTPSIENTHVYSGGEHFKSLTCSKVSIQSLMNHIYLYIECITA